MIRVVEILDPVEGAVGPAVTPSPWSASERARIERLCAVLSGDPAAAPDLAQETLLTAWRIRHRLVEPAGAGRWLDAVARNVCHRWRTSQARRLAHEQLTDADPPPGTHDPFLDLLERDELTDLLGRALALLPADTRGVLMGRYVEERLPHQLARELGTSPEAVSMRLVRGRARLRELLEGELADEPLARVWRSRYGPAWRETRLCCPDCGRTAVAFRRDEVRGVVELRCGSCGPEDVSAAYRLDNPAFADRLRDARRPSTVVNRMAAWAGDFWAGAVAGAVPCTRCGEAVRATPYRRPERRDPRTRRGWRVHCRACGEELSSSLGGLSLALPETRALRARRPRLHALPSRELSVDGRPVVVVAYRDPGSGDTLEVLFDDATSRMVAVSAPGAPLRRVPGAR